MAKRQASPTAPAVAAALDRPPADPFDLELRLAVIERLSRVRYRYEAISGDEATRTADHLDLAIRVLLQGLASR